jgi:hypothetical protein
VLEVHPAPDVGADTVLLFIGLASCDDCPGIQPPNVPEILPGDVYYREDSNRTISIRKAQVEDDGVARFRIESSDVGDTFKLAVAMDSNERSAALIQSLPLDTAGRYRVDLRAGTGGVGLGPKPATTSGNFVGIWRQPNSELPCMGFEQWSDGRLGERVFIVPQNDLDCDARPSPECAPYGVGGTGVPTFDEVTCTGIVTSDTRAYCALGGPACDELSGEVFGCAPSEYCLPAQYCDSLANTQCAMAASGGAQNIDGCLFNTDVRLGGKLKCAIGFHPSSDNSQQQPCDSEVSFEIFSNNSGLACAGPYDRLILERPATTTDVREFEDLVTYQTKDPTGKLLPFEIKLRQSDGCKYTAYLNGTKGVGAFTPIEHTAFAQFWVTSFGGAMHKVLVPIEVAFGNDCSQPSICQLVPDTSISACVR